MNIVIEPSFLRKAALIHFMIESVSETMILIWKDIWGIYDKYFQLIFWSFFTNMHPSLMIGVRKKWLKNILIDHNFDHPIKLTLKFLSQSKKILVHTLHENWMFWQLRLAWNQRFPWILLVLDWFCRYWVMPLKLFVKIISSLAKWSWTFLL